MTESRPVLRILGIRGIPAAHGGFETFAEKLAPYLVNRGWRVIVYCQEQGSAEPWHDTWQGVERFHIPVAGDGAAATMQFDLRSILHARKSPGLCLTLGYNTACFWPLLRVKGIRNVANMDGIEWRRGKWSTPVKALVLAQRLDRLLHRPPPDRGPPGDREAAAAPGAPEAHHPDRLWRGPDRGRRRRRAWRRWAWKAGST